MRVGVGYGVSSLTDELSLQMRPAYFVRLLALPQDRLGVLNHIDLVQHEVHVPNAECDEEQGNLTAASPLTAALLAFDVGAGQSRFCCRTVLIRLRPRVLCDELCVGMSAQPLQSRSERG